MSGVRRLAACAVALLLGLGALAGCTDEGNKGQFCEEVKKFPQVVDVLSELDTTDPGGTQARLESALRRFRVLETDAPGEIKADMARLRQGVELVLDAVKEHPDDLPGARAAILAQQDKLSGLAQAGVRVAGYVSRECGVQLTPGTEVGDGTGGTGGTGSGSSSSSSVSIPPTTR